MVVTFGISLGISSNSWVINPAVLTQNTHIFTEKVAVFPFLSVAFSIPHYYCVCFDSQEYGVSFF